jgi:hypothetical protein
MGRNDDMIRPLAPLFRLDGVFGRDTGGALAIAEHRVVGLLLDNNPFCRQEDRDYFSEGMRKAGVPGQRRFVPRLPLLRPVWQR